VKAVFGDTGYWIAVTNPHDSLHARAKEVSRGIAPARIVTGEMVFAEFLNDFSQRGEFLRKLAARFVERARADRNVTIVAQTSRQFRDALSMYATTVDKAWSLTDCASFLVMKRYGMKEALAHDRHFEQAGFKALLRVE
jgi:predicted nucleic acid-binding protein